VAKNRAILEAYLRVMDASWPTLHPRMRLRSARWASASEDDLQGELDAYVAEASAPASPVRVFWKMGPDFVFAGEADLDIIERQQSAAGGITWVRAGKAPIRTADGTVIGVLGMYELLDAERGPQLYAQRRQKRPSL
jgi:hypothetical protein